MKDGVFNEHGLRQLKSLWCLLFLQVTLILLKDGSSYKNEGLQCAALKYSTVPSVVFIALYCTVDLEA